MEKTKLQCPKCQAEFEVDGELQPDEFGASGKLKRKMNCPECKERTRMLPAR